MDQLKEIALNVKELEGLLTLLSIQLFQKEQYYKGDMNMLKKECTMKQYEIEIDDLMKIVDLDKEHENDNEWDEVLSQKLDMLDGITDSDYNGHFGHYIFLKIDSEYDNDKTWDAIETTIKDHIKEV
jgi:hypothetical protein